MLTRSDKESKKGFVLPFSTPTAKKLKDFTRNMEMAAILYLAESERKKGESRVLRKVDEKLVFVARACYPIWLVPCGGGTLIFDGLGFASHSLFYDVMPDVETFNRSLRENRGAVEFYTAALVRNKDYFRNFSGREEIELEGLISDSELLEDFKTYFHKLRRAKRRLKNRVFLANTVGDLEIREGIDRLSSLRRRTAKEIRALDKSMRLLNATTSRKVKRIRSDVRKIQSVHTKRIERIRPKVRRRILQIQSRYNQRIARKSKKVKRELRRLHEKRTELQKTVTYLKAEAKRCKTKMRGSKRDKKTRWDLRLKGIEKKLPALSKRIEACSKRSGKAEAALKLEVARQKTECDECIEAANKVFLDLQSSRDAEIAMKRREVTRLEELTSYITGSMRDMVQKRRLFLREFGAMGIVGKRRSRGLVYLPFYLARYEKGDKRRYVVYPPTFVVDMGILTRMKGALGAARLNALLRSRSKAIGAFLNQLVGLLEKNAMLEKEVTEAGIRVSILLRKRARVGIKRGLVELERQKWISKNELQAFGKILYVYTSATQCG
jgi:hypothetical protein